MDQHPPPLPTHMGQLYRYVSKDSETLYCSRHVGYRSHPRIPGTFQSRRFQLDYSSALHVLSSIRTILPVSVHPGQSSPDTSKLPRPSIIFDETANNNTDQHTTFRDKLEHLDHWQIPLLEHLECDSYESRFSDLLQTDTPITLILASDGGARDDLGSFGWAISIGQEILWKCKGPTFGLRPGSFRAESYGILSACLFLQLYFDYFQPTIEPAINLEFYCDSSSLLKRIARAMSRAWINPNSMPRIRL
jgi:hypothetical protein